MRVLIGRTFKYEKEDKIFVRGKDYPVTKELAEWIVKKRLGRIIPELKLNHKGKPHLKNTKIPIRDRITRDEKIAKIESEVK